MMAPSSQIAGHVSCVPPDSLALTTTVPYVNAFVSVIAPDL
jgi:hypothetical protein